MHLPAQAFQIPRAARYTLKPVKMIMIKVQRCTKVPVCMKPKNLLKVTKVKQLPHLKRFANGWKCVNKNGVVLTMLVRILSLMKL